MTPHNPAIRRARVALLLAAAALLMAGAAMQPTAAAGEVRIGKKHIAVTTPAGSAVIRKAPFGIVFRNARGRRLLAQMPSAGAGTPRALPPTEDPEPYTVEREPDHAVYAPFVYEVGTETRAQWKSGYWTGNTLFARRSGTVHSARSVVRARPADGGVRLVLATSERGRRLIANVSPDRGEAIRVRVQPSRSAGVISLGDSFRSPRGEGFYGFGGRHVNVNKRGQKLYGDAEQENFGGTRTLGPGLALFPVLIANGTDYSVAELGPPPLPTEVGGYDNYLFPSGPNGAYYPQAQFISSRGYGFLLNNQRRSRWRMANDRPDAWQVQASARRLDYTVALARGRHGAIRRLTAITGRHRLPPRWAQGPTVWRAVQVPALPNQPAAEDAASYRAKIERDIADIRHHRVKLSAYAFEGWALLNDRAYVRSVIRRLERMGIRTILYVRAYVSNDALATQEPGDYRETSRRGLVAETADGRPFVFGSNADAPATLLDFTNPATVRWWRKKLRRLIDLGADGFMQDFGEQVFDRMRFHDGTTGSAMANRYPVIWHRVSRRILDDFARRDGRRSPYWFFTRSGYSGRPGSAAYEMGNFPGDETADWSAASGLQSLAPDMLNRAVGGAFGYTTDIGGYADFLTGPPTEELFNRWSEWSALTPYFRVHNSATNGTRMPWSYGAPTLARWKRLAALHQRALPLIRRLWKRGRRTGVPVTRPMWLAAPEAPGAGVDSQQWMLGSNVLVAPVVAEGASTRTVSFPSGCWGRQGSGGGTFAGPSQATVAAPLGSLPYFFRCGTNPF